MTDAFGVHILNCLDKRLEYFLSLWFCEHSFVFEDFFQAREWAIVHQQVSSLFVLVDVEFVVFDDIVMIE
jgi:hypothetical protein